MSTLSLLLPLRNSSLRTLCSMWTSHRGGRSRALLEILALLIEAMRPLLMLLPECQLSSLLVTEYSRRFVQCCQVFLLLKCWILVLARVRLSGNYEKSGRIPWRKLT